MLRTYRMKIAALLLVAVGVAMGLVVWQANTGTSTTSGAPGGGDVFTEAKGADACLAQASAFTDYPLVWAGPSVLGYPLVDCAHIMTRTRRLPDGRVWHPGGDSCPIPVSIIMYPPCHSSLAPGAARDTTLVRGAEALVKSDGSLRIESPSHKLTIYGPGASVEARTENATRIGEALVPANALADSLTPGAGLSTALGPSTVCP